MFGSLPPLPLGIAALRELAGLTQAELARAIGVSRVTVARWEIRAHRPSEVMLLCLEDEFYERLLGRAVEMFRRAALATPPASEQPGFLAPGPGDDLVDVTEADFERHSRLRLFFLVRLVLDPSKVEFPVRVFERALDCETLRAVPAHEKLDPRTGEPTSVVSAADVGLELELRIQGTSRDKYLASVARGMPDLSAADVADIKGLPRIRGEALHQLRVATTWLDTASVMAAASGKNRESRGSSPLPVANSNGGERSGTTDV